MESSREKGLVVNPIWMIPRAQEENPILGAIADYRAKKFGPEDFTLHYVVIFISELRKES